MTVLIPFRLCPVCDAVGVTGAPQMFTRTAATYSLNPFQNAGEPLLLSDTTSASFLTRCARRSRTCGSGGR